MWNFINRNHRILQEKERHCTRFISLPNMDATESKKVITKLNLFLDLKIYNRKIFRIYRKLMQYSNILYEFTLFILICSASLRVPYRPDARDGPDRVVPPAGQRHGKPISRAAWPNRRSAQLESWTRAQHFYSAHKLFAYFNNIINALKYCTYDTWILCSKGSSQFFFDERSLERARKRAAANSGQSSFGGKRQRLPPITCIVPHPNIIT